ncbi:hypothetical protein N7493_004461 [Penicillium malachiteum]|uniref:Rhodopsin domain-containing protein n=1 Tax=Penicillium malachiteum TaxID=1324776 RepID=A0AAD6HPK2_9EURO|nr:hypothetical protein N7493_004461 [Penicillium malachiteum]
MAVTAENEHDSKGPEVLAVLWTLTSVTFLLVSARVFTRLKMLRNFDIDDYLIVVAMALGLAYCGATTASVANGFGQHQVVVESNPNLDLPKALLLNNISFLLGILSFTIPKIAVTFMMQKIFNPKLAIKIIMWTLVSTAAAVSCICIIILFTMCDPAAALWTPSLAESGKAKCKSTQMLIDYAIFTGALSAAVDLFLAFYPMSVLMKLQMSLKRRIALSAAMGLGVIAAAMAVVKCTQLHTLGDKEDSTYATAELILWTNIEANVVAIASCIPTLAPLLEIILGRRTLGSYSGRKEGYKGSNGTQYNTPYERSKRPTVRKSDMATEVESQESILLSDGGKDNNRGTDGQNIHMSPIEIRRTDDFTVDVEYDPLSHRREETPR